MEFVRLFKEIFVMLIICKSSWSVSIQPQYTKFMYEEQLLEKMVRLESFVENAENNIKKFIMDTTAVVKEIQNTTKNELDKMDEKIVRFKSEMDTFRTIVVSTLNQSLPGITEFGGQDLTDCSDIRRLIPASPSGVYHIKLWKTKQEVKVWCDMNTDGGGWTVFQKRFNGSVDFYRSFKEYEDGFGDINGEFWLGLKAIQELTANRTSELRLNLTAVDDRHAYEVFQNFYLTSGPKYALKIDKGTGTAGDSQGLSYSKGSPFYTYDNDNDNKCAEDDHGGWWYKHCTHANLNGDYIKPGTKSQIYSERGVIYRDFRDEYSLKSTVMMLRRV